MKKIIVGAAMLCACVALHAHVVFAANPSGSMQGMKHNRTVKKSLYDRLGGQKAIVAVVDNFVGRVAGDKRINGFFAKTAADPKRLAKFKMNLADLICMGSGGPCKYKGKSMKAAHAGMGITDSNFNALVQDLVATLNQFKVPKAEQKELLGILGPMKKDIVERPGK